jgi:tetratricopeptide (TPR) repeat protein
VTGFSQRLTSLLVAGAVLGLVTGCAATSVRRDSNQVKIADTGLRAHPAQIVREPEPIDNRAFHYFVNGLLFEGEGDLPNAVESYRSAWKFYPESAEIGLAYARVLAQMQQFPRALEALEKITVPSADLFSLRAHCNKQMGNTEQAKADYLDLVKIDSTNHLGYMFLASYYQQRKDYDSAEWAFENLARTLPDRYEVLNELAKVQTARGEVAAARETYHRSLELAPPRFNMDALMNLADLFNRENQVDSILVLFRAAVDEEPSNALLHMEIARLLLNRDSVSQALPHMWSVARLQPGDFLARRRLAIVLMSADSLQVADSILTTLVQAGDPDPATHFYLGRLAALQQDFFRARDEFQLVTQRADSLADGWLGLGFAYRRLNQPDREIQVYQDGLLRMRSEPSAIQLYFALGAAFEQDGNVDSAVATFEEILKHDPDHAQTLNYLGYLLADRGMRLEYARDLLERVIGIEPNNAAYLDSYGWVLFRLGEYQEAVRYLKMAAEIGSDWVIYDHLGDAYQVIGDTDRAREWWQKALDLQPNNETLRQKMNR